MEGLYGNYKLSYRQQNSEDFKLSWYKEIFKHNYWDVTDRPFKSSLKVEIISSKASCHFDIS